MLDLNAIGLKLTGTVRTNRKLLCPEVTIKKAEETALKQRPGYYKICFIW
jgi:hypothetical protein